MYVSTQGRQRLHILKNLKSFKGPVLKCRDSRKHRGFYLNELVIHEIRNNAPAIFQNFLFICCKIYTHTHTLVNMHIFTIEHVTTPRLHVVILKKSKRMRKEKTDRDPDLQVSGHGHRSGGSQEHTGQVRSQVRGSRKPQVRSRSQVRGSQRPETWPVTSQVRTPVKLSFVLASF